MRGLLCVHGLLATLHGLVLLPLASGLDQGLVVSHPLLRFDTIGNRLGVFGAFDSLAMYNYVGETSLDDGSGDRLYSYNEDTLNLVPIGSFNGAILQMDTVNDHTVVVNGNMTKYKDDDVSTPFMFDIEKKTVTPITSSNNKRDDDKSALNGTIATILVDGDVIYLGGTFEFNGSHGAAIYNITLKQLQLLPFRGFGDNGTVNSIAKIPGNNSLGLIVFGGNFDTVGFSELLQHNILHNVTKNTTNITTLINYEQNVPIANGVITLNGQGDPNALVCPQQGGTQEVWKTEPGQGGEWTVKLPGGIQGTMPTKIRLTIPEGDNLVKLFRVYTWPSNLIMNLSYVDPTDNTIKHCDAWCPLAALSQLEDATKNNQNSDDSALTFIGDDGAYYTYAEQNSQQQTVGYGSNYQDFMFYNELGVSQLTFTVLGWNGDYGALAGLQLFLDSIKAYANNQLNTPACPGAAGANQLSLTVSGDWQDILGLLNQDGLLTQDYLVNQQPGGLVQFSPNVPYLGDYQLNIYTPGCIADNSCDRRGIVDVKLVDNNLGETVALSQLWQNNDYDKFDYLYNGHLKGGDESKGYHVELLYVGQITPGSEPYMVADKVVASVLLLDPVNKTINSTNSTSSELNLTIELVSLNGIFEYSLDNFTNFDEAAASNISNNHYIGNSLINLFSGSLPHGSNVSQVVLGELGSMVVSGQLGNTSLITFGIQGYNSTGNEAVVSNMGSNLIKRDIEVEGVKFTTDSTRVFTYDKYWLFCGNFSANSGSTTMDNVAIFDTSAKKWHPLDDKGSQSVWTQFINTTISGTSYWVFSNSEDFYSVPVSQWQQNNNKRDDAPSSRPQPELKIRQAQRVSDNQQVLGGTLFGVMDYYGIDQAYMSSQANFSGYNGIQFVSGEVSRSAFINNTLSAVGGKFNTLNGIQNVMLVSNDTASGLSGVSSWDADAHVQQVYVNLEKDLLILGTNGSLEVGDTHINPGVVFYGIKNQSFTNYQPAALSNNDGPLEVKAIVMHNSRVLVGGNFTQAGSLDCQGLCLYDTSATRWMSPRTNGLVVTGIVNDIRFFTASVVAIAGDLSVDGRKVNFATYDFDTAQFLLPENNDEINALGNDKVVKMFVINDDGTKDDLARMVAFGDNFILGFDGKKWQSIDDEFDNGGEFHDLKLLELSDANKNYNETYFDNTHVLALAGRFSLRDFGLVNMAVFNGTTWIPYAYGLSNGTVGRIQTLLLDDRFSFLTPTKQKSRGHLSKGKVVGISLACALGLTALLGLLWLVPYIVLFRKQLDGNYYPERVDEKEMMDAVNPDDLLHEIDLHRNS